MIFSAAWKCRSHTARLHQLISRAVTQLINKTNQFNTTTRRYTAEQVATFATADDVITLKFRLLDRFGDNGLVSAMILHSDPARPKSLTIDNWVMSCRVFGRQLEVGGNEYRRRRGSSSWRSDDSCRLRSDAKK